MRLRSNIVLAFAVLTLLFTSGCSSDGDSSPSAKSDATDTTDSGSGDDKGKGGVDASGLTIVSTGFGMSPGDEDVDEYQNMAVVLRNDSDKVAREATVYIVTLDDSGEELDRQMFILSTVLPGATRTLGYRTEEPNPNVAKVTADISVDEWLDATDTGEVTVGEVTVTEEYENSFVLTGEITYSSPVKTERLDVEVLFRDADGNPIAVSSGYVDGPITQGETYEFELPFSTPLGDGWTAEAFASPEDFG